jgi:hypothetical protein
VSRKQRTVITLEIRLELPVGSNTAMALAYARQALLAEQSHLSTEHPMRSLNLDSLIIKLSRKETTYV